MIKALFPGSFDPLTYGHLNIIERSAHLFDHLDIAIGVNNKKKYLFSDEERLGMITELTKHIDNIDVHMHDGLTIDLCNKLNSNVIIRGVRNFADFSMEFDNSILNKILAEHIETLFLPTDAKLTIIKSSSVKEIASLGGDVSNFVPPHIEKMLKQKFL